MSKQVNTELSPSWQINILRFEVFTAVTMKNGVFWVVTPCGSCKKYQKFLRSVRRLLVAASVIPSSPIRVTLMKEALSSPKRRFLQESHGVTFQKTQFFIVAAVKTSNITSTSLARSSMSVRIMGVVTQWQILYLLMLWTCSGICSHSSAAVGSETDESYIWESQLDNDGTMYRVYPAWKCLQ
jgi:hypothetical protein